MNIEKEQETLLKLRKKIFITGYKGGMAHLASCYSCLEMLYAFYLKGILNYDRENPKWENRDRFILSKGHAGLALYAVLLEAGLTNEETFASYLTKDSKIGGEPCMRDNDWIESTTGSLGHGLSFGLGMAIALKSDHNPAKVYVMLGDGECQEGSIWEAAISASAFGTDNLIAIIDNNGIQKMDFIENTIGPAQWKEKWESFGWNVQIVDGHDMDAFKRTVLDNTGSGKPRLIIANTIKGKCISIMENNPNWHFRLPNRKELKVFKEELNISDEEMK